MQPFAQPIGHLQLDVPEALPEDKVAVSKSELYRFSPMRPPAFNIFFFKEHHHHTY